MVLFEKQIDFESLEMWSKSQREELFSVNPRGEVQPLNWRDSRVAWMLHCGLGN